MKIKTLTEKDYKTSTWSGGTTTQIMISPYNANYPDHDFLWRLSSATVDLDESTFTSLKDYKRLILSLSEPIEISHDDSEYEELKPFVVHEFDGASLTKSKGKCIDFNLMLRKGKVDGTIKVLVLDIGIFKKEIDKDTSKVFIYNPIKKEMFIFEEYDNEIIFDVKEKGHYLLIEIKE